VTTEGPRGSLRPASDVDEAGDEVSHCHVGPLMMMMMMMMIIMIIIKRNACIPQQRRRNQLCCQEAALGSFIMAKGLRLEPTDMS
jgi:hypothetical protein